MPTRSAFEYAIVRVVPRVDREEFINAGVILHCAALAVLTARIELDEARLLMLAPDADLDLVKRHLAAIPRICEGDSAAESVASLPLGERFRWLVAPRSTAIQISAPHVVLGASPVDLMEHLLAKMVRR